MALSVADVDRWNAEAVREVSYAALARSRAAVAVARELASLPAFASWHGATRDAAAHENAAIRQDLDAHGSEVLAVAHAAGKAADEIDRIKANLATLRADAVAAQLEVDAATSQVLAACESRNAVVESTRIRRAALQAALNSIVAEANTVDQDLAAALTTPGDGMFTAQLAASQTLPQDPKQFHDLWNTLTPEEKDRLYSQNHDIGNHPGMPWDPTDHRGKDYYNRIHLSELQDHAQADVDRVQHRVNELARQVYMGEHSQATGAELAALTRHLLVANHTLDAYQAVQADLNRGDGVRRYLGLIDDKGHAAVANGNPDYAKRNAVLVPGTGQDLLDFEDTDLKSLRMYEAALRADPTLRPGDVAVTTWMAYDRPMNLFEAVSPHRARAGAEALDSFENGQRASHVGAPSIDAVIGYSYGSTEVGAAATGGHHLDADSVIAVGSPGMLAPHASDLNLNAGANVYAMRAPNDIVELATDLTLGHDPAAPEFGGTRLLAAPGPGSDPFGLIPSASAHSSYWDCDNPALRNMGAVIAGVAPPEILPNARAR